MLEKVGNRKASGKMRELVGNFNHSNTKSGNQIMYMSLKWSNTFTQIFEAISYMLRKKKTSAKYMGIRIPWNLLLNHICRFNGPQVLYTFYITILSFMNELFMLFG